MGASESESAPGAGPGSGSGEPPHHQPPIKLILGSGSSARRQILTAMGLDFEVVKADIPEHLTRRATADELVLALAAAKAEAITRRLAQTRGELFRAGAPPVVLITADQVVVHEGAVREKPRDPDEARRFIASYSRAPASTVSGVMVTNLSTGFKKAAVDRTEVWFRPVPDHVVDELVKQGGVFEAAGGLLVEHPLVAPLVEAVVGGTLDSVMGLPKDVTAALLAEATAQL